MHQPAHGDDQLGQRPVGLQAVDEGLVDLQRLYGVAAQIGEVGVTGAEVVERNRQAQGAQRTQHFRGPGVVGGQQHAFGDLDFHLLAATGVGGEHALHVGQQIGVGKLPRREVH